MVQLLIFVKSRSFLWDGKEVCVGQRSLILAASTRGIYV